MGIVDIGSNTVRLSIVEVRPGGAYLVRHEQKAGLRLAARIGPDGALGPEAASETARVLLDFAAAGADWRVTTWLSVATAAVRQATDGAAFVAEISRRTGIPTRLLPAAEEAQLGLLGALNTLAVDDGYVVDIGGASTEVTRFAGRARSAGLSLPIGAVTAEGRFDLGDRAADGALQALQSHLDGMATAADWLQPRPGGTLIGIGGTVRALCKVDRRRRSYPLHATHNYALDPVEVCESADRLAAMTARERQRLPGMAADRADLIAAGAAILAWVIRRTAPARVLVSGSGLREGLFFAHLLRERRPPLVGDVLEASTANLERIHGLPVARGRRMGAIAAALWSVLGPLVGAPDDPRLPRTAARLREVGTSISYYDWERHTFYVLREARLYGLDHRERILAAAAAAYRGAGRVRVQLEPYRGILAPGDERLAARIGVVAALAHALDRACRGHALPLRISAVPSAVRVAAAAAPAGGNPASAPLADDFRKAFGRALAIDTSGAVADA